MDDHVRSLGFELARACVDESVDRAHGVLKVLMNATGAVAGLLAGPNGVRTGSVLAVHDYSAPVVKAITEDFTRGPTYNLLVTDTARPLRNWREVGEEFVFSTFVRDHLIPSGYRGGVTMRILDDAETYLGDLHLSTADPAWPTDAEMLALHMTQPILAGLCHSELGQAARENRPSISSRASVGDCESQVVARLRIRANDQVASVVETTDLVDPRAVAVIARGGRRQWRRELRCLWPASGARLLRVHIQYRSDGAAVTVIDAPIPYGLTRREVEVLSHVWAGLSNYSISLRTGTRERTVAAHISAILAKTGSPSRARAAVIAEQEGLVLADVLMGRLPRVNVECDVTRRYR
ncbi:helix-turn-helix transcriptional regulator [Gordonia shandongensis]|uniref:helix-turn-helix transcriptional regulator n=1 Tax=Gordonia shandongensis TaxID=376351 RepID=UPI0004793E20|nr:LuxR C-terminal-related transcriptional regulator [Gordonia shandongensis]